MGGVEIADQVGVGAEEVWGCEVAGQRDLGVDRGGLAFDSSVLAHEVDLGLDAAEVALVFAQQTVAVGEVFDAPLEDSDGGLLRGQQCGGFGCGLA